MVESYNRFWALIKIESWLRLVSHVLLTHALAIRVMQMFLSKSRSGIGVKISMV